MKSSKHVETCFVRANNDFDDKLTAFWMKKFFGQISLKFYCQNFSDGIRILQEFKNFDLNLQLCSDQMGTEVTKV